MSFDSIARIAWKQAGADRALAKQAYEAQGGDPDALSPWLPTVWDQFAALNPGNATPADLTAQLPELSPNGVPSGNAVTDGQLAADALAGGTVPVQEVLVALRAWATALAAGGSRTFAAYPGNVATDDIGLILAWISTSVP